LATKEKEIQAGVTIKELLAAGAHFGHQSHRWNPKMKRFIFEERAGIYIIDLAKTMQQIRTAVRLVEDVVTQHKPILFVGTKKQAKAVIRELTESCAEFYVCERWLGGMLTNLTTIRQSIKTLERIEKRIAAGGEGLTKKEVSQLTKEQQKLDRNLSGIRGMRKTPGLLVVVDSEHEKTAVLEARKLGIPVMALVDTNGDPDLIDHVIACNDDSLKSIKLILGVLVEAIIEKKKELRIPINPVEEEGALSKDDGEPIEEEDKEEEEK
jgi:small subunit ribosomal protein S2